MAKRFLLVSVTLKVSAPTTWTDAQTELVIEGLAEEAQAGVEAVGAALAEKFGNGQLTFETE